MKIIHLLVVLLCVGGLTVHAQDDSSNPLIDALRRDGRFTLLVAALEADALLFDQPSGASITLFAPTDTAFDAALDFLNLTPDQLLADADALRALLINHSADGRLWFRTMAQGVEIEMQSGARFTSALADGRLRVGSAAVSTVDQIAGDHVFHALESVLLPDALLAPARLRVAHFAPDAPAFDVLIDAEPRGLQQISFPAVTGWLELDAGVVTLTFVPVGGGDALIIPAMFTLRPNISSTIALIGSFADDTIFPLLIDDLDLPPLQAGYARITVVHAVENLPELDFRLDRGVFVSRLAYPYTLDDNNGQFTFDKLPGRHVIDMRNYGSTPPLLLEAGEVELIAGARYLGAAVGSADAPTLIIAVEPPRH